MTRRPAAAPARAQTAVAVTVLVGLEIALIALLTAIGVTGTPAVVTVVVFALVERVAYVRWFKRRHR
ncbi:hypothetical protein ACQP60_10105 [Isoptericola variabilis]|uniref:hypothetical protein n=1 Tax=Isoptericola variabilis TaxID=139208 RepID=UPI003D1A55D6